MDKKDTTRTGRKDAALQRNDKISDLVKRILMISYIMSDSIATAVSSLMMAYK